MKRWDYAMIEKEKTRNNGKEKPPENPCAR